MITTDFLAISPLLIVFAGALALLLCEIFYKNAKKISAFLTLAILGIALYATSTSPSSTNPLLTPWLKFDALARFFTLFFLAIGIAITFISCAFFKRFDTSTSEYYFFLLSSLFGLLLISAANDFLTFFIGLETLSIALYVLCGYMKQWTISHEASFKYFLLGSISTSFLLFGIALVYGATGSTRLDTLVATPTLLFSSGMALITLSLLFKAAIVPFHVWAPDVYAGSPSPVTAFMAVAVKAGAFAILIRLFLVLLNQYDPLWNQVISYAAYLTLIFANLCALRQVKVKVSLRRFFAYSGISHAGFLLIPLAAATPQSASAMLFYLAVYTIATLGAFSMFLDEDSNGVTIGNLTGLFHSRPLFATIFSFCLLTLAGIPPTVGFFAKFYLFKVAYSAGYYGLIVVGLLTSILSAYYYLKIISIMMSQPSPDSKIPISSWPTTAVGIISLSSILALSFYPEPILNLFSKICM